MFNDSLNNNGSMSVNETQSLICVARSILMAEEESLPYTTTLNVVVRSLKIIFSILIIIFGVLLNSLVVVLVKKFKSLQTLSFTIALQVIVINLIKVSIKQPASLVTAMVNKWLFGEYICIFFGFVVLMTLLTRTLLLFTLILDRFCNVFMPFYYPGCRRKVMLRLSLGAWSLAMLLSIIMLPRLTDCYRYLPHVWGCYPSPLCNEWCAVVFGTTLFLVILPSCIVPIFLFGALFWKARKIKKSTVVVAIDLTENGENGNVTRYQIKTTIFFLLFVSLFIVTLPPLLIYVILDVILSSPPWIQFLQTLCENLIGSLVIMDPLFIMQDRDMKIAMAKLKWVPRLFC